MYTFKSLDCTSQARIKFQTLRSIYVEKAYTVVLLIAISSPNRDIKPDGPLGGFRE